MSIPIMFRSRPEPRRMARLPGVITEDRGDRWLVLADLGDPDQCVLELYMGEDETAREAADRLAAGFAVGDRRPRLGESQEDFERRKGGGR